MFKTCKFLVPLLIVITSSCDDDGGIIKDDSYFPLENNTAWTYQRFWRTIVDDEIGTAILDTVSFRVDGDTIVDFLSYKTIRTQTGIIDKIVRREGSKYFGRHHEFYGSFSKEYLFLDTSLPAGASWSHVKSDGFVTRTEYIIKAKGSHRTFRNKIYSDVIEVEVNYYYEELGEEKLWVTAAHYYSKNVGEIYTYYPYPVSLMYSDVESVLMTPGN